jgi:hypothetical protein
MEPIHALILDTVTKKAAWSDHARTPEDWAEGNHSCDCNRYPDPDPNGECTGYCLGCKRFLIIGYDGDPQGYTLYDFNRGYPEDLLRTFGILEEPAE